MGDERDGRDTIASVKGCLIEMCELDDVVEYENVKSEPSGMRYCLLCGEITPTTTITYKFRNGRVKEICICNFCNCEVD